VFYGNSIITKNKGAPPVTLSQTLDLQNFATASRQQKSSTVKLVHDIYDGRGVVAVYNTSVNRNSVIMI